MCGICGEVRFDGRRPRADALVAMRDRLVHRGPDSDGLFVSAEAHGGLGFRRLRVIDLTPNASQPMTNEDGTIQVVLNGEIYNFRELRQQLIARGHRFRSCGDTETIVHLYEEKGSDCITDLHGMFAIAIWDDRTRRLTLARDRVGKKPLFVHRSEKWLVFASEIKSFFGYPEIAMDVDAEAVPYYFIHGYVPGPATFYRNVRQLEPGTVMTVGENGRTTSHRYWRMAFPRQDVNQSVEPTLVAAAAGVRERLTLAVERRLVSDVPLGAFLSGGIDSTIVVGLMSRLTKEPVKTFSIGFEGDATYDETSHARAAAECFKTDHTEFRVRASATDLLDRLIWHYDGPFGDSSAIPTYIVSKLTRQKVTVVLTGDGGDELFAGYLRFYAALLSERLPASMRRLAGGVLNHLPTPASERSWLARAQRFVGPLPLSLDERITSWNALFYEDLFDLLRPEFVRSVAAIDRLHYIAQEREQMSGRSTLGRLLHANFTSYLPDDLLVKTDRCTMANSLEARSPFLDHELVEYVASLPDDFKLRGRSTKYILRLAFADLLPATIERRGKMGFGVPLGAWFRGELRERLRELLLAPDARYTAMVSRRFVEGLVARHLSGRANLGQQLWSLMCFERWLQLLPDWKRGSVLGKEPALAHLNGH